MLAGEIQEGQTVAVRWDTAAGRVVFTPQPAPGADAQPGAEAAAQPARRARGERKPPAAAE